MGNGGGSGIKGSVSNKQTTNNAVQGFDNLFDTYVPQFLREAESIFE